MKEGLLEKIRSIGHWRVNLRPIVPLSRDLNFEQCLNFVQKNTVSIRGWDYPHISRRQDADGGLSRGERYYESWCDWWGFYEFWRMYKSGQFLSYNVVREDALDEGEKGSLNIIGAIYTVTEFVEFAHRLHGDGLYIEGLNISIELRNSMGRRLSAGRDRMPFFSPREAGAQNISLQRTLSAEQIKHNHRNLSVDMILELFDYFGWNPERSQIEADQERFYRRDF